MRFVLPLALALAACGTSPAPASMPDAPPSDEAERGFYIWYYLAELEYELAETNAQLAAVQAELAVAQGEIDALETEQSTLFTGVDGLSAEIEVIDFRVSDAEGSAATNAAALDELRDEDGTFGWAEITRGKTVQNEATATANAAALDELRDEGGTFGWAEITRGRTVQNEAAAAANAAAILELGTEQSTLFTGVDGLSAEIEVIDFRVTDVETGTSTNAAALDELRDETGTFGWAEITRGRVAENTETGAANAAALDELRDEGGTFGWAEITRGLTVQNQDTSAANAAALLELGAAQSTLFTGVDGLSAEIEVIDFRVADVESGTATNAAALDELRDEGGTFGWAEITRGRTVENAATGAANAAALDELRDEGGTFGWAEITRGLTVQNQDTSTANAAALLELGAAQSTLFTGVDGLSAEIEVIDFRVSDVESGTATNAAALDELRDEGGTFGWAEITRGRTVENAATGAANAAALDELRDEGGTFGWAEITRGRTVDNGNAIAAQAETLAALQGDVDSVGARQDSIDEGLLAQSEEIDALFGAVSALEDADAGLQGQLDDLVDAAVERATASIVSTQVDEVTEGSEILTEVIANVIASARAEPGSVDDAEISDAIVELRAYGIIGRAISGEVRRMRDATESSDLAAAGTEFGDAADALAVELEVLKELNLAAQSAADDELDFYREQIAGLAGGVLIGSGQLLESSSRLRDRDRRYRRRSGIVTVNVYSSNGGDD
jgi:hypothetical protein